MSESKKKYCCLFCGKEFTADQVLFSMEMSGGRFYDEKRWNMLDKCGFYTTAGADIVSEARDKLYPELYFLPTQENLIREEAGFPTIIEARPCDALTPTELEKQQAADGAEAPEESTVMGYGTAMGTAPKSPAETAKPTDDTPRQFGDRSCPYCHCHLPFQFQSLPNHVISLYGGRAAGKTAYLVCLMQQLDRQLTAHNLGTVTLLPESEKYIRPKIAYYEEHGTTEPTPVGVSIFPLIFEYTYNNNGVIKSCYISINDIAGEGVSTVNYLLAHEGLKRSETLLLMIDPNQLCDGLYYDSIVKSSSDAAYPLNGSQGRDAITPATSEEKECYRQSIAKFLADAVQKCGLVTNHLRRVIVVITKFDMPLTVDKSFFAAGETILKHDIGNRTHIGAMDFAAINEVNRDLNIFLNQAMGQQRNAATLKHMIQGTFHNTELPVYLTCVSTRTMHNAEDGSTSFVNDNSETGPKHRIIEPFIEILAFLGMIPCRMPQAQPGKGKR